jgi:hypothetical protein
LTHEEVEPILDSIDVHDSNEEPCRRCPEVERDNAGIAGEKANFLSSDALILRRNLEAILDLNHLHSNLGEVLADGDHVVAIDGMVADTHREVISVNKGSHVVVEGKLHFRVSEGDAPDSSEAQLLPKGVEYAGDLAARWIAATSWKLLVVPTLRCVVKGIGEGLNDVALFFRSSFGAHTLAEDPRDVGHDLRVKEHVEADVVRDDVVGVGKEVPPQEAVGWPRMADPDLAGEGFRVRAEEFAHRRRISLVDKVDVDRECVDNSGLDLGNDFLDWQRLVLELAFDANVWDDPFPELFFTFL